MKIKRHAGSHILRIDAIWIFGEGCYMGWRPIYSTENPKYVDSRQNPRSQLQSVTLIRNQIKWTTQMNGKKKWCILCGSKFQMLIFSFSSTQALLIDDSFAKDFDAKSALQSIIQSVSGNVTLLNAYYALPVLFGNSLLNVSSSHCKTAPETEAEALEKALNLNGETISVQFSVWFGNTIELSRIWWLKMHPNNSIYDVIETVSKIDNRQKVEYNVVEGKPFVTSLGGIEDDPERGTFWFIHLRNLNKEGQPELMEQSPVDLKLKPNQEIVLWYKPGPWSSHPRVATSTTSN
ncbi:gastric intrinsic factor [Trichonephila clavipes]|nr:gastric intrinsic factor [Trichonephila clavipes]